MCWISSRALPVCLRPSVRPCWDPVSKMKKCWPCSNLSSGCAVGGRWSPAAPGTALLGPEASRQPDLKWLQVMVLRSHSTGRSSGESAKVTEDATHGPVFLGAGPVRSHLSPRQRSCWNPQASAERPLLQKDQPASILDSRVQPGNRVTAQMEIDDRS